MMYRSGCHLSDYQGIVKLQIPMNCQHFQSGFHRFLTSNICTVCYAIDVRAQFALRSENIGFTTCLCVEKGIYTSCNTS